MLSLTRKTEYALIALTHLAGQGGALVSARDVAGRFGLPLPLLMNILNELTRRGLVSSTRGAKGGYRLAREPNAITLAQVIRAMEGPVRLTACCSDHAGIAEDDCTLEPLCPVKLPVRKVHDSLEQFLGRVTLAYLASETVPVGLSVGSKSGPGDLCLSGAEV